MPERELWEDARGKGESVSPWQDDGKQPRPFQVNFILSLLTEDQLAPGGTSKDPCFRAFNQGDAGAFYYVGNREGRDAPFKSVFWPLVTRSPLLTIPVFLSCDLACTGSQKPIHPSHSGEDLLRVTYHLSEVSPSQSICWEAVKQAIAITACPISLCFHFYIC
jgi:hypothetical protein